MGMKAVDAHDRTTIEALRISSILALEIWKHFHAVIECSERWGSLST